MPFISNSVTVLLHAMQAIEANVWLYFKRYEK